ncbi:unnamed protein product, partial [Closterium sp. NIES-54]
MNWTYTKAQLEAHGDPHLLVHSCESLRRTVDGVDVVGNRLADELVATASTSFHVLCSATPPSALHSSQPGNGVSLAIRAFLLLTIHLVASTFSNTLTFLSPSPPPPTLPSPPPPSPLPSVGLSQVRQVILRNPQLRRISFIAHSLGGVLSRYAIAQMYQPACTPASDERPSNEPASREPTSYEPPFHKPPSHEPSSHEPPSHEPSSHEPPSHDATTSNPAESNPLNNHLHGQTSQEAQSEEDCVSSSSCAPPPEEHSPDTTFPTCASTSSLPSDAPSLPRHLMPKSPSVSVLDVLRKQEEQSQLTDSDFPPMLCLDAEDEQQEEQQQNGERQSQGQGKEHGFPEEGGRVEERERDFAAAESEGERATESTSRSIDFGCNVEGLGEEMEEEEEEGEGVEGDEEEEEEDEEGGGRYQGPRIAGLEPMNFVTLASPHLGSRGKGHLPFLLKVSLFEKASVPLAPLFLGRSARHLFLTDVDPPVETTDAAPSIDIGTADANPHIDSTGAVEPQIEPVGVVSTRTDTTGADRQPGTADVDSLGGDSVAGKNQADGVYGNPSTGCVDLLNVASGAEPPLDIDTTLSSSVDTGRPLADHFAKPVAEALAAGAEAHLGHSETRSSVKGAAGKQQQASTKEQQRQQQQHKHQQEKQQQHGMVRLHRLGSSLIDVTRVAAAEGRLEETTGKGVGSHKVKHQLPLLLRMTTDNEEGPFLSALAAFKYRAAYANVLGDQMVGWRTASIRHQWEMPSPDELHELPDYRFIVRVQPMQCQSKIPVQPMRCESEGTTVQPVPCQPEPRAPGCIDTGAGGEEKGCFADTSSQHLAACDASLHASAAAASVADFAQTDTTGALAAEASDFMAGNATGSVSGGPSGDASGGPSGGSAAGPPETKEHANFFARLKGRWKMGGRTASSGGFGLNFGLGSPQQQFLPCQQQPLKLKDKGHTKQGEGGEQAFENHKNSPDDPPEGSPEEGEGEVLQLVRSMSEGMVPRGASGRGSGGGGIGGSSEEGSCKGKNRTGQRATKNDEGHGSDEGWRGDETKARRAAIGGPTAAGGAGAGGATMLPRAAGKHSIHMQWEDTMVENLNRVPWARIDVNFASSPLAFLAHILIQ